MGRPKKTDKRALSMNESLELALQEYENSWDELNRSLSKLSLLLSKSRIDEMNKILDLMEELDGEDRNDSKHRRKTFYLG